MARQPRIDLPGFAQHVIQRGVNRETCFYTDDDRRQYLAWLQAAAESFGVSVHAYVLMSNHAHLLVTGSSGGAIGHMMHTLGTRYVRFVNAKHGRTGTLWEGRYKSNLVDSDQYLLTCYRYIELNPVRSGIVKRPGQYRWSSFGCNARGARDELITPHATYLALGTSRTKRALAYRRLFDDVIASADIDAIRKNVNQGKVWGSDDFVSRVQSATGRRVRWTRPGRPPVKAPDAFTA